MAVRPRNKNKGPVNKGFRPPKHQKKVRLYDLAPSELGRNNMSRKDRLVQDQMKGVKYVKQKRQADTKGLDKKDLIRSVGEPITEFKTQERQNETLEQYEHRLRMEQLRIERGMGTFERKTSERRLEYKRERRQDKAEKKRAKKAEDEKDLDFTGHTEHIKFGDIVERPPSFADLALPGETLTVGGKDKKQTNLEKLQNALKTANSTVKDQFGTPHDMKDFDEESDDDDDPRKREIKAQQKKAKQLEREKLLKIAREKQRQVEVEKARIQAQAAYQQLKSKRNGEGTGSRVHMGTLTAATSTIYKAGTKAMRDLASVDGGIYHHGR